MKIEGVTVSIGQHHLLEKVMSNNDKLDRWIVVTHKSDVMTKRLCKKNGVEFVLSDRVFDNANFAKGRAVNDGLDRLDKTGWILHTDGDIRLPDNFRDIVESKVHDKNKLYYCRRFTEPDNNVARVTVNNRFPSGGDVDKARFNVTGPTPVEEIPEHYVELNRRKGLTLEAPITYSPRPYGYFQLWHNTKRKNYSQISENADIDDVYVSYSFYPNWELLWDLKVIDVNPWCSNWEGPKSDFHK
jgi:hypothetical protein